MRRVSPPSEPRKTSTDSKGHLAGDIQDLSDLKLTGGNVTRKYPNSIRHLLYISHNSVILPIQESRITRLQNSIVSPTIWEQENVVLSRLQAPYA